MLYALQAVFCVAALIALGRAHCLGQEQEGYGQAAEDPSDRLSRKGEFDPNALEDVRIIARVTNEESMLPRLPIMLKIAVVNTFERSLLPEPTLWQQFYPHYTVEVLAATGDNALEAVPFVVMWKWQIGGHGPPPLRPQLKWLETRNFWTIHVPVTYLWADRNTKLLSAPGEVRFQVRYYGVKYDDEEKLVPDRNLFVESNVISVRVPVPEGRDAQALEAVEKMPNPRILCTPQYMQFLEGQLEELTEIANTYSDTAYGTYAKFALANSLIWKHWGTLNPPDSPELQKGIDLVREALRDPRFVLDEEARQLLWQAELHQEKLSPIPFHLQREFPTIQRRPSAHEMETRD